MEFDEDGDLRAKQEHQQAWINGLHVNLMLNLGFAMEFVFGVLISTSHHHFWWSLNVKTNGEWSEEEGWAELRKVQSKPKSQVGKSSENFTNSKHIEVYTQKDRKRHFELNEGGLES